MTTETGVLTRCPVILRLLDDEALAGTVEKTHLEVAALPNAERAVSEVREAVHVNA